MWIEGGGVEGECERGAGVEFVVCDSLRKMAEDGGAQGKGGSGRSERRGGGGGGGLGGRGERGEGAKMCGGG